jgi:hypothetical protein
LISVDVTVAANSWLVTVVLLIRTCSLPRLQEVSSPAKVFPGGQVSSADCQPARSLQGLREMLNLSQEEPRQKRLSFSLRTAKLNCPVNYFLGILELSLFLALCRGKYVSIQSDFLIL